MNSRTAFRPSSRSEDFRRFDSEGPKLSEGFGAGIAVGAEFPGASLGAWASTCFVVDEPDGGVAAAVGVEAGRRVGREGAATAMTGSRGGLGVARGIVITTGTTGAAGTAVGTAVGVERIGTGAMSWVLPSPGRSAAETPAAGVSTATGTGTATASGCVGTGAGAIREGAACARGWKGNASSGTMM